MNDDFNNVKNKAEGILNLCHTIIAIQGDLDVLNGSYREATKEIEKLIENLCKTKKLEKNAYFEAFLYNEAIDACSKELRNSTKENYLKMERERYMDIIKIFNEWK